MADFVPYTIKTLKLTAVKLGTLNYKHQLKPQHKSC